MSNRASSSADPLLAPAYFYSFPLAGARRLAELRKA